MKRKSTKRSNGEGTVVFETDRNKYRAFLTDPAGKRISKRFDSKADALQWITETKADIYRDEYVSPSDITLGEWIITYLETYKKNTVRDTTYQNMLYNYRHFDKLSEYALQDINNIMLQKLFNNLELSVSTKRLLLSKIKPCFAKAVSLGMIKTNPAIGIVFPKISSKTIEVFTQDEANTILTTIKNDKRYKRYYPYFALAFVTGMRIGELNSLKIANVHDNYVYVNSSMKRVGGRYYDGVTKTETSIRIITVPSEVIKSIKENHDGVSEYAFYSNQKNPHSYKDTIRIWKNVLALCNFPYRKFHTIRHTHATLLISKGVPLTEIAKRLGHKNCQMLIQTYAHWLRDADISVVNTVQEIFALHPFCSQNN